MSKAARKPRGPRGRPRKDDRIVSPIAMMGCNALHNGRTRDEVYRGLEQLVKDLRRGSQAGLFDFIKSTPYRVTLVSRTAGVGTFIEILTTNGSLTSEGKLAKEAHYIFDARERRPREPSWNDQRIDYSYQLSALFNHKLFIQYNAPAQLEAMAQYKLAWAEVVEGRLAAESVKRPVYIVNEGVASCDGWIRYLAEPSVVEWLKSQGPNVVPCAWMGGLPGAIETNWTLKPVDGYFDEYGVCTEDLDCAEAIWIIVPHNDAPGRVEAQTVAGNLIKLGVPKDQIKLAASISVPGQDDGNPLPNGMCALERVKQVLLGAEDYTEPWVLNPDDNSIHRLERTNRERAIRDIGLSISRDVSTGKLIVVQAGEDGQIEPSDTNVRAIAGRALAHMGHVENVNWMNPKDWRPDLESLGSQNLVNSIRDAMMERVENGRIWNAECIARGEAVPRFEDLYVLAWSLPPTRYHELAGYVFGRDWMSLIFRDEPVPPQSAPILVGPEGIGKSEFVKVIAGGTPGGGNPPWYEDNMDFDLLKIGAHDQKPLYDRTLRRWGVEFPDKAFGESIGLRLGGILRNWVNLIEIRYRDMFANEVRSVKRYFFEVFTINRRDLLSANMGERRWIIIDLYNLPESVWKPWKVNGCNPNLNWLTDNMNGMIAEMYDRGDWRASNLALPAELMRLLPESQADNQFVTPALEMFEDELMRLRNGIEPIEIEGRGIAAASINAYFHAHNLKVSQFEYSEWLKRRGWITGSQSVRVQEYSGFPSTTTMRVWFYKKEGSCGFGVFNKTTFGPGGIWTTEMGARGKGVGRTDMSEEQIAMLGQARSGEIDGDG